MEPLQSIVYVSSATQLLTETALENILTASRRNNAQPHPAGHTQPAEGLTLLQVFCQNAARL